MRKYPYTNLRRYVLILLVLAVVCPLSAQDLAEEKSLQEGSWAAAFSEEGRQNWKPEFTFRLTAGFVTSGPALSGGVRIDNKRTLGLIIGHGECYNDARPESDYMIQTSLFFRRYFYIGPREIVALYSDISVGANWIYKVNGSEELIKCHPGDVRPQIALEPGVRFRIYRNFHLFLGPSISTSPTIGFHIGLGL